MAFEIEGSGVPMRGEGADALNKSNLRRVGELLTLVKSGNVTRRGYRLFIYTGMDHPDAVMLENAGLIEWDAETPDGYKRRAVLSGLGRKVLG